MAKDVLITPASGLVDFKDTLGSSDATIQLDDLGNLNISNPGGELSIGDGNGNLYIGDGVASVDIIFEQNGAVRALTGKTLTLGQSDSFVTANAITTIPALRSFSDTNDPATSTTMFGRDTSQNIRMHGGSGGNYVSSLSSSGNPKNLTIRANRGTTNFDFVFASDTGTLTATSFSGNGSSITSLNASNISSGTLSGDRGVTAGSTSSSFVEYSGTTATAGQWYGGTTTPTGSTRLNYSGFLYPTFINLSGSGETATAATHYFVETGSDGFVRPKTLNNVKAEIVTGAAVVDGLGYDPGGAAVALAIALG